ncbi:hypothetical protein LGM38_14850 [Burkholderia vietnamiensis]|uniref:hypothetical protein n=1 Tax=Burkholderia vietnamiensis TaxID=60552 RepID=UPI001CF4FE28|nr:hypothetical protein [Burkholderia vietnamiensis]MCA8013328.1 hypothetical protein [Burkholderia vietnamiensis]
MLADMCGLEQQGWFEKSAPEATRPAPEIQFRGSAGPRPITRDPRDYRSMYEQEFRRGAHLDPREIDGSTCRTLNHFGGREVNAETRGEILRSLHGAYLRVMDAGVERASESDLLDIIVLRRYLAQCDELMGVSRRPVR